MNPAQLQIVACSFVLTMAASSRADDSDLLADTSEAPTSTESPDASDAPPVEAEDDLEAEDDGAGGFQWTTAGGRYTDPSALFALHGYVDGVFAGPSDDWTAADPAALQAPGQLLVPNTNDASFQFDAALIFSSEMSDRHRVMIETHLVSDPSGQGAAGPGGLTVALTEATVSWDVYRKYLTVSGGIYWAPFGIVNDDWLGAQSRFTLIPRAAAAFPTHYNERGIRVNGAVAFTEDFGVNYVVSYGNGVQTFGLDGQSAFDASESKSFIGRLGLFPGLGDALEVGYSVNVGVLRETSDATLGADSPNRYPADMIAHGADVHLQVAHAEVRGYYIRSIERLGGPVAFLEPPDLERQGMMIEGIYDIPLDTYLVAAIAPKLRFDWIEVDALATDGASASAAQTAVYSAGFNFYPGGQSLTFDDYPHRNVYMSFEYHVQRELRRAELDNDRFLWRFTGRF